MAAMTPPNIDRVDPGDRSLFPTLTARSYLAHAAISPPPTPVAAAAASAVADFAARGLAAFGRWGEDRGALKQGLARLVGGRAEDYALTQGTTAGVVMVAQSFPWRAGDRVALFDGEFPANITPWRRAAARFGLAVESLPVEAFRGPAGDGLARLELLLAAGVRLVAVSAVQFQSGLAMPVAEIGALCARYGAALFVDAIQAVGAVPVDCAAWGAHFVAGGAHKWLMGLEGAGYLYVHPSYHRAMAPHLAGWLSHEAPVGFLFGDPLCYERPFRPAPGLFEGGTASTVGFAALRAAVDLALEIGVAATFDHVQAFHDRLEPTLSELGFASLRSALPAGRSGILSARLPHGVDLAALRRGLAERGIVVTSPQGLLRLAPSWPNALEEADYVAGALRELVG